MGGSSTRHLFLKRSADIERVKKIGRRVQTPLFHLAFSPTSGPGHTRIGIIISKRLGKATVRNRAKRIFRELARQVRQQLVEGRDVLVFPRRDALAVSHRELREAWASALKHEGLLVSPLNDSGCDNSASG